MEGGKGEEEGGQVPFFSWSHRTRWRHPHHECSYGNATGEIHLWRMINPHPGNFARRRGGAEAAKKPSSQFFESILHLCASSALREIVNFLKLAAWPRPLREARPLWHRHSCLCPARHSQEWLWHWGVNPHPWHGADIRRMNWA